VGVLEEASAGSKALDSDLPCCTVTCWKSLGTEKGMVGIRFLVSLVLLERGKLGSFFLVSVSFSKWMTEWKAEVLGKGKACGKIPHLVLQPLMDTRIFYVHFIDSLLVSHPTWAIRWG
jgi:hypothetical protein